MRIRLCYTSLLGLRLAHMPLGPGCVFVVLSRKLVDLANVVRVSGLLGVYGRFFVGLSCYVGTYLLVQSYSLCFTLIGWFIIGHWRHDATATHFLFNPCSLKTPNRTNNLSAFRRLYRWHYIYGNFRNITTRSHLKLHTPSSLSLAF